MTKGLLSDVEARAQRRRTQTRAERWKELVEASWARAQSSTAKTPTDTLRWLQRAHRMLPQDGAIALALATALLRDDRFAEAGRLFRTVAEAQGVPDAWAGAATCAVRLGDMGQARAATLVLLRCSVLTPTLQTLADRVAGPGGWCALTAGGALHTTVPLQTVRLDGRAIPPEARHPATWRGGHVLEAEGPSGPLFGSPLPLRPVLGVDGFVEAQGGGLSGWAWHPGDPAADPVMHITGPRGTRLLTATAPASVHLDRALARPRLIHLAAEEIADLGVPLGVRGPDGRHLLGSPLDPGLEARSAIPGAPPGFGPVWAEIVGPAPVPGRTRPPVDVVVPVYRGCAETMACLDSVLASLPRGSRVIVVDDDSPDPALRAALAPLARRRRITLIRLPENRGFPGAANAGLAEAAGRDAVLLNSDTLVPPGWLERLRAAAYASPSTGSATPLTNDGTIVSYPDPEGGNPVPDLAATIATDRLAQTANAGQVAPLPVGVGFCLYLRRDCLDQTGPLREDLFAQGYGEENDWCLRARHRGWRHVAALDVFVAHVGSASFGPARTHLVARNGVILNRLHPGYDALIAAHEAADPLAPARARMDALRWAAGRRRAGAVAMVTHGGGGGVERVVAERARAVAARGQRAVLVRPHRGGAALAEAEGPAYPNLVFPMPAGLPDLARLLRADRVRTVELHHMLGHHAAMAGLARAARAEAVSVVHDYARFCPRIALVSTERRYCGEPDVAGCEACVADLGSLLEDDPPVPELLRRSAAELAAAARVIVPSADAAARIARHFPGVAATIEPWEDDPAPAAAPPPPAGGPVRIVVVGAIGVEKGFEVLLGCVRDARARGLPLEFVVVGFTADDERLMAAGPAFVTGEYAEEEAVPLIRAQGAHAALIPSVWPETWCFALGRAWQAGLRAFVFDLGAQAERMRRTGAGWLLPLGLSPRGVNDALLRLAPGRSASHSPPQYKSRSTAVPRE